MAPTPGVASPFIGGDGRPLLEPGALYVDGSYALRLNAWSTIQGVTLAFRSRFLRASDGELVNSGDQLALAGGVALNTSDVQLSAGFPLNVQIFALTGAPTVGQCFVQVQIVSGQGAAALPLATVLQGYITATQALSWPGSPIQNSLDGQGALVEVSIGNPVAGFDTNFSFANGLRWQPISYLGHFVASGAAANRFLSCVAKDGANTFFRSPLGVAVVAGQVVDVSWMAGFGAQVSNANLAFAASLPIDARLLTGFSLGTETINIQAADQWSAQRVSARVWIDV